MGRIISTFAVLLLFWAAKFGYNVVTAESPGSDAESDARLEAEWIAEDQDRVEQEIAEGSAEPARGWLSRPQHGTFEANPRHLDTLIDEFHAAGTVRVWMVGIEPFAGKRHADSIAVELPGDPDIRADLFAIEARTYGGEGTRDVGQKFLTISLD
jgi:hypothetical protein